MLSLIDEDVVRSMSIRAVFSDFSGKIHSLDFHLRDDLLVTASEDDSVRIYDIANAKLLKTTYHKKHGTNHICLTHHPSSVTCSSRYNLESSGESLRYLSMSQCQGIGSSSKRLPGDTVEVCDIKFCNDGKSMFPTTKDNNIYVLDAYQGKKHCGFSLESSPGTGTKDMFTPEGKYLVAGSGGGIMHTWSVVMKNEVACWNSHIGMPLCLKSVVLPYKSWKVLSLALKKGSHEMKLADVCSDALNIYDCMFTWFCNSMAVIVATKA
ncbi:hypothetical protein VNO77_03935 [Canavalia gladiata]|uniref:Uncharacterized protein n=1 Tax=Canavalia gladiata TaxID=3824 RepID=A0AAN9R4D3_CANGL